jgi:serine/threonine protein phosphatase PrpC
MAWHFEVASHIGARPEQQDRAAVLTTPDGSTSLAVLADGLGGHQDGAAAAQTVLDVARRQLAEAAVHDPQAFLTELCGRAHQAITELGRDRSSNPASTCVLLLVRDNEAYWVHVGDSRLYHFRRAELLSQTTDHSVAAFSCEDRDGRLAAAAAGTADNQLYMCLGGQNALLPEFGAAAVDEGDWFLLCSDGLWSQVAPGEASRTFVESGGDPATAAQLAQLAARRGGSHSDNVSLVLAANYSNSGASRWRQVRRLFSFLRPSSTASPP